MVDAVNIMVHAYPLALVFYGIFSLMRTALASPTASRESTQIIIVRATLEGLLSLLTEGPASPICLVTINRTA